MLENKIRKYDKLLYDSGPVKFTDYMNNKYDNIHKQLFNIAKHNIIVYHIIYIELQYAVNYIKLKYHIELSDVDIPSTRIDMSKYIHTYIEINKAVFDTNPDAYTEFMNIYKERINKTYILNTNKILEIKNTEYWMPSTIIMCNKIYPYNKHKFDLKPYWPVYNKTKHTINELKISSEPLIDNEVTQLNYVMGNADIESRLSGINYKVDFDYLDENTNISSDYLLNQTFTYKFKNIEE